MNGPPAPEGDSKWRLVISASRRDLKIGCRTGIRVDTCEFVSGYWEATGLHADF